ncbi:MAG: hypothetical protein KC486_26635 [Myxococcales bacterium]|nr:hypothetical protein [Myxococcales bacterium]
MRWGEAAALGEVADPGRRVGLAADARRELTVGAEVDDDRGLAGWVGGLADPRACDRELRPAQALLGVDEEARLGDDPEVGGAVRTASGDERQGGRDDEARNESEETGVADDRGRPRTCRPPPYVGVDARVERSASGTSQRARWCPSAVDPR